MELKLLQIREAQGDFANSPDKVAEIMAEDGKADRECFWVLHLNTKNQIIEKELAFMGYLSGTSIHPREVFRKALLNSSASIITVHNHPSGDPEPSQDDENTWKRLNEAGKILGIEVLDHITITPNGRHYSFKDNGR